MAPTAVAPAGEQTEASVAPVTFISISPNQVLTRRPEKYVDNGLGGKVRQSYEDWLDAEGRKNHEREISGLESIPVDDTPWKVEFENHIYDATHPGIITWLREHPRFNVVGPSGFYEEGAAPDEPKPTLAEQVKAIAEAAAEADVDKINEALQLERDTHKRVPVIQAAEAALRSFAGSESDTGAGGDSSAGGQP